MSTPIRFFAPGEPKGQPRARAFAMRGAAGSRPMIRMYDPSTAEGWKSSIAAAAQPFLPQTPLASALVVNLHFVMPRPASHYGSGKNSSTLKPTAPHWYAKKPDRDNLDKAVLDALTTLGMWGDDAQVVDGRVGKRYQRSRDERTGVFVEIEEAVPS